MKRTELRVEHRYENRFLRQRQLRPGNRFYTLGSSRDADFRLLGTNVSGIHAVLEFREGQWYYSDVSRTEAQKTGVETPIKNNSEMKIGEHTIGLRLVEVNKELFQKEDRELDRKSGPQMWQQVVVRLKGHIVDTQFIPADSTYEFKYGMKSYKLDPPKNRQWVWKEIDNITIQQRLVYGSEKSFREGLSFEKLFPKEMRFGLFSAFGFIAVLFLSLSLVNQGRNIEEKQNVVDILVNKEDNPYTQMIFDAKVVKKKMAKSEKISASILDRGKPKGPNPDPNAKVEVLSPHKNPSGKNISFDLPAAGGGGSQQAIKQIKASNLAGLIGRISKRVVTGNSGLVKVNNKDNSIVNSALPQSKDFTTLANIAKGGSISGSPTGKGGVGTGTGNGVGTGTGNGTQRIGGIGTIGAGGASSYREYGALTPGSVGSGSVATIEEEADIGGGLDKEAIAQYIQTQIGFIRYCYERQLSAKPDLYGKIKVQFMIGATGSVSQSKIGSSTLQDAVVEGCILKRVASWVFPQPKGGTSVLVSYPFLFKSTN